MKKSVLTLAQAKPKILCPAISPRSPSSGVRASSALQKAPIGPLSDPISTNNQKRLKISFPSLPFLKTAKQSEIKDLLVKKCKIAQQKVDLSKKEQSMFSMAKIDYLKEILSAVKDPSFKFPQDTEAYASIFSLAASHIFRTIKDYPELWDSVHDDYYFELDKLEDNNWGINSLVYEIITAFLSRDDFDINISSLLATDLFKLVVYLMRTFFISEQKSLELLFIAIFQKIGKYRHFAQSVTKSALIRISINEDSFVACRPLLNVYRSIVDGFKVPLKQTHKDFYYDVILPLHHHEHSHYFWTHLVNLVSSYLEKDDSLTLDTYKFLMTCWPRVCTTKQLDFVDEIGILASFVPNNQTTEVVRVISSQFCYCVMGVNSWISKRILALFDTNDFVWLITERPEDSYPLLIPSLYQAGRSHWDEDTRELALSVLNVLRENNKKLFSVVGKALRSLENAKAIATMERGLKWKILIDKYEPKKLMRRLKTDVLSMLFVGCEALSK